MLCGLCCVGFLWGGDNGVESHIFNEFAEMLIMKHFSNISFTVELNYGNIRQKCAKWTAEFKLQFLQLSRQCYKNKIFFLFL